jgi:acyl-CoA hydrolase
MNFLHPIHVGQLIVLHSQVNRVFHTSMEVGVKVVVEDLMTGRKQHTCSAYLTFVALDARGQPAPVQPVVPETEEEQKRYREAGERRAYRLAMREPGGTEFSLRNTG